MEITTKYSIGDVVYVLCEKDIRPAKILMVYITVRKTGKDIKYAITFDGCHDHTYEESELFPNEDELVKKKTLGYGWR